MKESVCLKLIGVVLIIAAIIPLQSHSQTYIDVVKMRTGGTVQGTITEWIHPTHIQITREDGFNFTVKMENIVSVMVSKVEAPIAKAKDPADGQQVPSQAPQSHSPVNEIKGASFFLETQIGLTFSKPSLVGNQRYSLAVPGIHAGLAGRIGTKAHLGLGFGLDKYAAVLFVPIYGNFRWFFLEDTFSPFLDLGIGYALASDMRYEIVPGYEEITNNTGGLYLNSAIGLKYKANSNLGIYGGLGYKSQSNRLTHTSEIYGASSTVDYSIGQFSLKMGLAF